MRSRACSSGVLLRNGRSMSSARAAASASMASTARVWRTTRFHLSAEVMPILTKSSLLPLVVMEPEEAG